MSDVFHSDQRLKDSFFLLLGALPFSLLSSIPLWEYTRILCLSTFDVQFVRTQFGVMTIKLLRVFLYVFWRINALIFVGYISRRGIARL